MASGKANKVWLLHISFFLIGLLTPIVYVAGYFSNRYEYFVLFTYGFRFLVFWIAITLAAFLTTSALLKKDRATIARVTTATFIAPILSLAIFFAWTSVPRPETITNAPLWIRWSEKSLPRKWNNRPDTAPWSRIVSDTQPADLITLEFEDSQKNYDLQRSYGVWHGHWSASLAEGVEAEGQVSKSSPNGEALLGATVTVHERASSLFAKLVSCRVNSQSIVLEAQLQPSVKNFKSDYHPTLWVGVLPRYQGYVTSYGESELTWPVVRAELQHNGAGSVFDSIKLSLTDDTASADQQVLIVYVPIRFDGKTMKAGSRCTT